jgi:hypothetical protein
MGSGHARLIEESEASDEHFVAVRSASLSRVVQILHKNTCALFRPSIQHNNTTTTPKHTASQPQHHFIPTNTKQIDDAPRARGASRIARLSQQGGEFIQGWEHCMPEDVFILFFSYLDVCDLAQCARVNAAWYECVYNASLWRKLDLSHMRTQVNDALLAKLLSSHRFSELDHLSLEGCSAVTDASMDVIAKKSPRLRTLLLTECDQLTERAILTMAKAMPRLERLEVYGAVHHFALARRLKRAHNGLDMGYFWLCYAAYFGKRAENGMQAACRHEGVQGEAACMGRVRGRVVYTNVADARAGNFPKCVVYSCQAHRRQDLSDPDLSR